MYLAELRGKMPSIFEGSEDILTSNVFSFFKYANRRLYLKQFLEMLGISADDGSLDTAEFFFWPTFPDGTEPDVVIIAGDYYILIEAKLCADFGLEDHRQKAQLERENVHGLAAARELGKKFIFITITADYIFPKEKFKNYSSIINLTHFKWINWQSISKLLVTLLENQQQSSLSENCFAFDLLNLLDKKKLRNFHGFKHLNRKVKPMDSIFFSAASAIFRGCFIGFNTALKGLGRIQPASHIIFHKKLFFTRLQSAKPISRKTSEPIFYSEGVCYKWKTI